MVDVTYYEADVVATQSDAWAEFGDGGPVGYETTTTSTQTLAVVTFGDVRPVGSSSSVAATQTDALAIHLGTVATGSSTTVAATQSTATVTAFGAVAATCIDTSHATLQSTADAIIGATAAEGIATTTAATQSTATAVLSSTIATGYESYTYTDQSGATATIGHGAIGRQRGPRMRRPYPASGQMTMRKGAAVTIYAGQALGGMGDDVWPLRIGDRFAGFAVSTSSEALALTSVVVQRKGFVRVPVAGVTSAAVIGSPVYALHDDSFTLSAAGGAVWIGNIARRLLGTTCTVAIDWSE